ncbi:hypothetical protein PspLS_05918 [Pyricularia sp. CBS 133598]|nr:hypothetical protein PspLS_05918 [Pyricularia sp. CBS 133598]
MFLTPHSSPAAMIILPKRRPPCFRPSMMRLSISRTAFRKISVQWWRLWPAWYRQRLMFDPKALFTLMRASSISELGWEMVVPRMVVCTGSDSDCHYLC